MWRKLKNGLDRNFLLKENFLNFRLKQIQAQQIFFQEKNSLKFQACYISCNTIFNTLESIHSSKVNIFCSVSIPIYFSPLITTLKNNNKSLSHFQCGIKYFINYSSFILTFVSFHLCCNNYSFKQYNIKMLQHYYAYRISSPVSKMYTMRFKSLFSHAWLKVSNT